MLPQCHPSLGHLAPDPSSSAASSAILQIHRLMSTVPSAPFHCPRCLRGGHRRRQRPARTCTRHTAATPRMGRHSHHTVRGTRQQRRPLYAGPPTPSPAPRAALRWLQVPTPAQRSTGATQRAGTRRRHPALCRGRAARSGWAAASRRAAATRSGRRRRRSCCGTRRARSRRMRKRCMRCSRLRGGACRSASGCCLATARRAPLPPRTHDHDDKAAAAAAPGHACRLLITRVWVKHLGQRAC